MTKQTDVTKGVNQNRSGSIAALLTTLIVATCGGDGGETTWTVTRVTADGTEWVENTPPEGGGTPTMVAEEEFRIGTVEGGGVTSFGLIRSLAVLPDGRFAVADGQAEEVRLFDRGGQHLRTFGGDGEGPGDLRGMQGVQVDHEGMLRVAEQGNARLSVFHPDTGLVRTIPLRLHSYGFRGPWPAAAIDSAGRTVVASSGQYGEGRFWNMLRIYDAAMTQLDSIPYYDYTDDVQREETPGAWRIEFGNGWTWAGVPFFSRQHEVLTPTGEFWSSTEGHPVLEVARWAPQGDTSLVLTSRRIPDPVTTAERDSAMTELRDGLEERFSSLPGLDPSRVPNHKPPLYGLSVDDRGRLWARLTEPTADTTAYDVFDRDGTHAESILLPFRVDGWVPPVVRGDTVWAVVTDEMDVQYVLRARFHPSTLPITG